MKLNKAKGFYLVGVIFLSLQIPVLIFDVVVGNTQLPEFVAANWSVIAGYFILCCRLFLSKKTSEYIVMALIGAILWIMGFFRIFMEHSSDKTLIMLYIWGVLGIVCVLISVILESDRKL